MADSDETTQVCQLGVAKDLGHQSHFATDANRRAIAYRHAGALLATMLERVQAKIRGPGYIFPWGKDPEYTTFFVR
jgi:hypothetical protein